METQGGPAWAEYAMAIVLFAVVAVMALVAFGGEVSVILSSTSGTV